MRPSFAEWFRTDKLFVLRNSALYLNLRDADLIAPEQVVDRGDALLLVSIAGEILAEIQSSVIGTGAVAANSF
jgi:hypothetical protein